MGPPTTTVFLASSVGVVTGLVLPTLIRRLLLKSKNNDMNSSSDPQAVRSGLSSSLSIRLSQSQLNSLLSQIIDSASGCGAKKANLVASVLSYADSRGIPSHGANRCDTYVNEIAAGLVDGTADPVVEQCSGGCAVINGNNGLGAATAHLAMTTAIQLAKEHGVAVVTCHSSNHYGAAGFWAQMALDQKMIGMSFTNTSPIAVPTGGNARAVGTNPFCFFAPAADEESFQLDMATTVVPIGKVEVMDRIGKPVPPGWGVDGDGKDCTDAAVICKQGGLYPLGGAKETAGYKGYGLGVFVEILCSVLSGASVGPDVPAWNLSRDGALNYGHCFVVMDPTRFVHGFEPRLGQYLNQMRGLPGNVLVAGDPEKEFERDAAENGILLHESVATTLKALAVRFQIEVPPELKHLDERKSKSSLYE